MNPYVVLELNPSATREEVNKAYRRLAIKWHPDVNHDDAAPRLFEEASAAYEILSDLKYRAAYDQFGQQGLDDLGWKASPAGSVFFKFTGSNNPFDHLLPSRNATEFARLTKPKPPLANEPLLLNLEAPLSDFIFGHVRMVTGTRHLAGGKTEDLQIAVKIHPGMAEGTKVVYPRLGHAVETESEPADAVVTVTSQPHFIYARYGQDLVYTQNITLSEALAGRKFKVPLLDGRVLPLHLTEIASPGYKICITGEGVPVWDEVHNEVTGHGNLFVAFNVEWPVNRSDDVWKQLVAAFESFK